MNGVSGTEETGWQSRLGRRRLSSNPSYTKSLCFSTNLSRVLSCTVRLPGTVVCGNSTVPSRRTVHLPLPLVDEPVKGKLAALAASGGP